MSPVTYISMRHAALTFERRHAYKRQHSLVGLFCEFTSCVAVCCSALQRVAVRRCSGRLSFVGLVCEFTECVVVRRCSGRLSFVGHVCGFKECVAVCCSVLQCVLELVRGFTHKRTSSQTKMPSCYTEFVNADAVMSHIHTHTV